MEPILVLILAATSVAISEGRSEPWFPVTHPPFPNYTGAILSSGDGPEVSEKENMESEDGTGIENVQLEAGKNEGEILDENYPEDDNEYEDEIQETSAEAVVETSVPKTTEVDQALDTTVNVSSDVIDAKGPDGPTPVKKPTNPVLPFAKETMPPRPMNQWAVQPNSPYYRRGPVRTMPGLVNPNNYGPALQRNHLIDRMPPRQHWTTDQFWKQQNLAKEDQYREGTAEEVVADKEELERVLKGIMRASSSLDGLIHKITHNQKTHTMDEYDITYRGDVQPRPLGRFETQKAKVPHVIIGETGGYAPSVAGPPAAVSRGGYIPTQQGGFNGMNSMIGYQQGGYNTGYQQQGPFNPPTPGFGPMPKPLLTDESMLDDPEKTPYVLLNQTSIPTRVQFVIPAEELQLATGHAKADEVSEDLEAEASRPVDLVKVTKTNTGKWEERGTDVAPSRVFLNETQAKAHPPTWRNTVNKRPVRPWQKSMPRIYSSSVPGARKANPLRRRQRIIHPKRRVPNWPVRFPKGRMPPPRVPKPIRPIEGRMVLPPRPIIPIRHIPRKPRLPIAGTRRHLGKPLIFYNKPRFGMKPRFAPRPKPLLPLSMRTPYAKHQRMLAQARSSRGRYPSPVPVPQHGMLPVPRPGKPREQFPTGFGLPYGGYPAHGPMSRAGMPRPRLDMVYGPMGHMVPPGPMVAQRYHHPPTAPGMFAGPTHGFNKPTLPYVANLALEGPRGYGMPHVGYAAHGPIARGGMARSGLDMGYGPVGPMGPVGLPGPIARGGIARSALDMGYGPVGPMGPPGPMSAQRYQHPPTAPGMFAGPINGFNKPILPFVAALSLDGPRGYGMSRQGNMRPPSGYGPTLGDARKMGYFGYPYGANMQGYGPGNDLTDPMHRRPYGWNNNNVQEPRPFASNNQHGFMGGYLGPQGYAGPYGYNGGFTGGQNVGTGDGLTAPMHRLISNNFGPIGGGFASQQGTEDRLTETDASRARPCTHSMRPVTLPCHQLAYLMGDDNFPNTESLKYTNNLPPVDEQPPLPTLTTSTGEVVSPIDQTDGGRAYPAVMPLPDEKLVAPERYLTLGQLKPHRHNYMAHSHVEHYVHQIAHARLALKALARHYKLHENDLRGSHHTASQLRHHGSLSKHANPAAHEANHRSPIHHSETIVRD